ncbi:sensor histidine kinase [Paenibacillus crassostreae]|uniref:histidine kinase n=1 Tax=Paenibacillus crassostreae TaxID=1763538 RepID=A0A167GRS8_9BACL|nr:HAMP domain-containing sensor histidine kinase [Paenibacillus crassostreae]AOZ92032.1 hypothetical protein LPB68_07230 [Paenibacillus crassostreae]OAB77841.1 hypothetical protein PNBC_00310 [Paenibacillus crassostreae]
MKWVTRNILVIIFVMIVMSSFNPIDAFHSVETKNHSISISNWQYYWGESDREPIMTSYPLESSNSWVWHNSNQGYLKPQQSTDTLWIKFRLPAYDLSSPALYINKVYAKGINIYINNTIIYQKDRSHKYDLNTIFLPLKPVDAGKEVIMSMYSERDRLGIDKEIVIGDYQPILKQYVRGNIIDIIAGVAVVFVALVMVICSVFLSKGHIKDWISVNIVLLSVGIIIITYSPFLYTHYGEYGHIYLVLFDIALYIFLPGLTYVFESMIGIGYGGVIRKFRKIQMIYFSCFFAFMFLNLFLDIEYERFYLFSLSMIGTLIIIQGIILMTHAVYYGIKGNKDAGIIAWGFTIFTVVVIAEFSWFFLSQGKYELFIWKWGLICFITSFIILLGRKLTMNHRQVIEYSKELERFNNELQRSEKMDIISELAASVAHEVRNPLQVTRGFLQLLEQKSKDKDKEYLRLALDELDRASDIITDFLTFAKPEIQQATTLDVLGEFRHIEGILLPLANYQAGRVQIDIPSGLLIIGNASKFKQAFVNMIKNSIEALGKDGLIRIWAYEDSGQIVIHILDNGVGMEDEDIKHLGEPYYSNKTRGTGLGLMVTFRIIEAMNGSITFTSEKWVGTEVITRFPSAYHEDMI